MNEFTVLREHGPEPTPLSEDVLAKARADLLTEIRAAAPTAADGPVRLRRRTALIAAAAAVLVTAGIVATGGDGSPPPPSAVGEPPVLVGFDMPTLPPELDPIPDGVTEPGFTAEPGWIAAVYRDADQRPGEQSSAIYVKTHRNRPSADGGRDTTYAGKPAVVERVEQAEPGFHSVSLTWERSSGQWITITGTGDFADEQALRSLADTLVDTDERVSLAISVAPAGWELYAFKDAGPDGAGAVTSLRDPRAPDRVLHVSTMLGLVPNYGEVVGGGPVPAVPVSVDGRPGELVHLADDRWMLQAPLPDGRAFQLQVPAGFTEQQVIELAEGVG
ncbi:hypothetical protein [Saccharothrix luteola]|uniref:hypothetical protein n=1 Tax=Saccharothrix luteola TaxID=2893018 RepID=UPI001E5E34CE|nr:hypothetical protein [Saccharothrix luteola]MCC8248439.1 hypothetical protein [Saccharothrix luteola]